MNKNIILAFSVIFLAAPISIHAVDQQSFSKQGQKRPNVQNKAIQKMEQERRQTFEGGPSESEEQYYKKVAPPQNIDNPNYFLEDHPLQEKPLQEKPIK